MRIAILSASPSSGSRSAFVAEAVGGHLTMLGAKTTHLALSRLPVEAMVFRRDGDPAIERALSLVAAADGVVIVTPIYKASFSGLLKIFLDLLPQFGLARKTVLPLAVGGSLAHVLALDYGLRPVLQSMRAGHVARSHFVLDKDIACTIGPQGAIECDELLGVMGEFVAALPAGPAEERAPVMARAAS
ncbi:NAD(P)H-dependent oxidoreductase [Aureimonas populi]|uniref:NAD(P)H-dependent oxidoreductase n=1 Tax=Aureimonas populi TaxID=1701758 RepID=A0ABW5CN07_9HYPH|nr:NAD(P)H-dependent oxidoreductase [Aureimonas populi]